MFIERHFKIDRVLDVQCREIRRYAETPRESRAREHSALREIRWYNETPRRDMRVSLQSKKSEQHTQRTQPHAAARTHRSEERSEPSRKKRAQRATADSKSFIATQACGASHDSGGMHLRLLAPLVDRLVGGSSVSHQDSASVPPPFPGPRFPRRQK